MTAYFFYFLAHIFKRTAAAFSAQSEERLPLSARRGSLGLTWTPLACLLSSHSQSDALREQAHCSSLANYNSCSSYLPSLMPIITVVRWLTSDPSLGVLINCHCSQNFEEFEEDVSLWGIKGFILQCVFLFPFWEWNRWVSYEISFSWRNNNMYSLINVLSTLYFSS